MLNVGSSPDVEQERLRWEVTAQQVLILPSHPAGISRRTGVQFHFPVQTRPDVSRALWEPPLARGAGRGGGAAATGPSQQHGRLLCIYLWKRAKPILLQHNNTTSMGDSFFFPLALVL